MKNQVMQQMLANIYRNLTPIFLANLREVKVFNESGLPAILFKFDEVEMKLALEVIRLACYQSVPDSVRKHGVLIEPKYGGVEIRIATNEEQVAVISASPRSPYDIPAENNKS